MQMPSDSLIPQFGDRVLSSVDSWDRSDPVRRSGRFKGEEDERIGSAATMIGVLSSSPPAMLCRS